MPWAFGKNTEEITDEELIKRMDGADLNSPVGNFALAELTRRAANRTNQSVSELKKSIDGFNISSDKYSQKLVTLTWVLVVLTVLSLIAPVIELLKLVHILKP